MSNIKIADLEISSSEMLFEIEPLSEQMDRIAGGGFWGRVIGSTVGRVTGHIVNYFTGSNEYDDLLAVVGGDVGDAVGDYIG